MRFVFMCYLLACYHVCVLSHRVLYTALYAYIFVCNSLPHVHLFACRHGPDDAVTGVQTGQSSSGTPLSGAAMATMLSSDDEGVSSGVQRESSFVSTDLGDGIMDIRNINERKGAIPGTHKVRLSWATAFLRQE